MRSALAIGESTVYFGKRDGFSRNALLIIIKNLLLWQKEF
nr:MAG TPA: hypothetical protein [Microviridae sp.]